MLFIKGYENTNNLIDNIILKERQLIRKIYENKNTWQIPVSPNNNFNSKRIGRKLAKKLYKNETQRVVLSEELQKCKNIENQIYNKGIDILDGRKLFEYVLVEVIEYIFSKSNKLIENAEVSILTNNIDESIKSNIIEIAKIVKKLNIISNHTEKFKSVEKYLYDELGIMIMCTNNKKKSIGKSDVIINMDFTEELLNKYKLPTKAVIVNVQDKVNINAKKFEGINCNFFKLKIPDKYKIEGFLDEEVYESICCYNNEYKKIRKEIEKDKIKVLYLIGNNGPIDNIEFEQIY